MDRRLLVLLIATALTGYFGYHAHYGRYGLEARAGHLAEARELRQRLHHLETERSALERDIALLQDGDLDPDLLDEQARALLGFAAAGEIIVRDGATNP